MKHFISNFISCGLACSIGIFLVIFGRNYSSSEKESIVSILLSIIAVLLFLYNYLRTSIDDTYEKEEFVLLGVACFIAIVVLILIVI